MRVKPSKGIAKFAKEAKSKRSKLESTHQFFARLSTRERGLFAVVTEDISLNSTAGIQNIGRKIWHGQARAKYVSLALTLVRLALNCAVVISSAISVMGQPSDDNKRNGKYLNDSLLGLPRRGNDGCYPKHIQKLSAWQLLIFGELVCVASMVLIFVASVLRLVCSRQPHAYVANHAFALLACPRIASKFSFLMFLHLANVERLQSFIFRGEFRCIAAFIKNTVRHQTASLKDVAGMALKDLPAGLLPKRRERADSWTPAASDNDGDGSAYAERAARQHSKSVRSDQMGRSRTALVRKDTEETRSDDQSGSVTAGRWAKAPRRSTDIPFKQAHAWRRGTLSSDIGVDCGQDTDAIIRKYNIVGLVVCVMLVGAAIMAMLWKLSLLYFACLYPMGEWDLTEWILFIGFINQVSGVSLSGELELLRILLFKFGGETTQWGSMQIEACATYFHYLATRTVEQLGIGRGIILLMTLTSAELQALFQGHMRQAEQASVRREEEEMFTALHNPENLKDLRDKLLTEFGSLQTLDLGVRTASDLEEGLHMCNTNQKKAIGLLRLAARTQEFIWEWSKVEMLESVLDPDQDCDPDPNGVPVAPHVFEPETNDQRASFDPEAGLAACVPSLASE